ncbi:hypothetical protein ACFLS1_12590, partial [Verrucomicrobiota bacterium]
YNSEGADDGMEWIELFNPTDQAIDLGLFSIGSGGNDYTYSTFQLSGTINPFSYFVVGGPGSSITNYNPVFDQAINFSPDLQNNGSGVADGVALFDVASVNIESNTVPIDVVIYGPDNVNNLLDETGFPGDCDVGSTSPGRSLERTTLDGDWQSTALPNPGTGVLPVPEPCTGVLALCGFAVFLVRRRRFRMY